VLRAAETTERTDVGRQRRGNEDSSYARAPLFVVADGMGGARAGEVASQIAISKFEEGLPDTGTPEERLSDVVQRANREIYERSQTEDERAGMGTTVTAAYVDEATVAIAHVGDSRAYLFRDGELVRLTQDHSLVDELVRRGKLTEEQAAEHPQRSIITRALGPEPVVEVDTWTYTVRAGDVVMLCSDGLTSMLPEAQINEIVSSAPNLRVAADRLIDEANEAGGRDNITVVLFRIEEVGGWGDGGPADSVDQPTEIRLTPVGAASAGADRDADSGDEDPESPEATTEAATGPAPVAPPKAAMVPPAKGRRAPLARTQGRAPARRERHFGAIGKLVAGLVSLAIVLFLFGGGGYLASRQLYFLGTNSRGLVTVYRGFPYVLPFGIRLYETFYTSGVPASLIPPDRRTTLLDHDLRSQTAATKLVNDLELGEVSG
jgi:PPM family protein phosphatase